MNIYKTITSYVFQSIEYKFLFYVLVNFVLAIACPMYGQALLKPEQGEIGKPRFQKQLKVEDYDLWETVWPRKISDNGEWVSYNMYYEDGKELLYLKNAINNIVHAIPYGVDGSFSTRNHCFAYLVKEKGIGYVDLKTGRRTLIPGATTYSFSANGNYLAIYIGANSLEQTKRNTLFIIDFLNEKTHEIENVSEYGFNGKGNQLVYFANNETHRFVTLKHLGKDKEFTKVITSNVNNSYLRLLWDKEVESFTFLEAFKDSLFSEQSHIVHHYYQEKLYSFDHRKHKEFPKGMHVSGSLNAKLLISKDAQRVFFGIAPWTLINGQQETDKKSDSGDVQVWHWKDEKAYPRNKDRARLIKLPKLSVWWPSTNAFMQIAALEHPNVFLTGNQMHALTFHPLAYTPQFKYVEKYIDIYITDLTTGEKELFLKQQLNSHRHTLCSPAGNYISYFKDRDWWIYHINNKTHFNLTKRLPHPSYTEKYSLSRSPQPYGNPGWTNDDEEIIIYDEYDVWLLTPDGASQKNLTNGRISKTQYRIYEYQYRSYIQDDFWGFDSHNFNLRKGLLFSAFGEVTKKSGYFTWRKGRGIEKIVEGDKHIDQLKKARNKNIYITMEQRFDMPPKLMLYSKKENVTKEILTTNPQHQEFYWGRSELIDYEGIKGEILQGVLFYPANYQADKKYPLVVSIYEKQSEQLHHYVNPSLQTGDGFNPSVYTTNGYFVLYPDIEYEYNNPGISATRCVVSAVEKVLEQSLVDKDRIGLRGHSFGGYETALIITQTNLFAAAVSGAASVDLVSKYLSFYEDSQTPEINFFETSQFRFTGSFYEYPDAYLRNSPIHNLQKINTPLLSFHGGKDGRVNVNQGIEMYNAMRRLEKEHIFLVYPNEEHILDNPENQADLSKKILHWFGYKLKGEPPMAWVLKGEGK